MENLILDIVSETADFTELELETILINTKETLKKSILTKDVQATL